MNCKKKREEKKGNVHKQFSLLLGEVYIMYKTRGLLTLTIVHFQINK